MKHRLKDPCRACGVWAAQADRGTGVRYHQGPDGVPAVLLRGLEAVSGEWSLVTMAWNIRRMAVLRDKKRTRSAVSVMICDSDTHHEYSNGDPSAQTRSTAAGFILSPTGLLAQSKGFKSLADVGVERVLGGTTTLDEVSRVVDITERFT